MIMIKNHNDPIYQNSIPGWFSSNEDFLLLPIDVISYGISGQPQTWLVHLLFESPNHQVCPKPTGPKPLVEYLLLLIYSKHEHTQRIHPWW